MEVFRLWNVISSDFAMIRKKALGKVNLNVIKSNSCNAEDSFQDKVLYLLENYGDHSSSISHLDERNYILSMLREKLQPKQYKHIPGVIYDDNHDNTVATSCNEEGYFDKLKLLLVHYQPCRQLI